MLLKPDRLEVGIQGFPLQFVGSSLVEVVTHWRVKLEIPISHTKSNHEYGSSEDFLQTPLSSKTEALPTSHRGSFKLLCAPRKVNPQAIDKYTLPSPQGIKRILNSSLGSKHHFSSYSVVLKAYDSMKKFHISKIKVG